MAFEEAFGGDDQGRGRSEDHDRRRGRGLPGKGAGEAPDHATVVRLRKPTRSCGLFRLRGTGNTMEPDDRIDPRRRAAARAWGRTRPGSSLDGAAAGRTRGAAAAAAGRRDHLQRERARPVRRAHRAAPRAGHASSPTSTPAPDRLAGCTRGCARPHRARAGRRNGYALRGSPGGGGDGRGSAGPPTPSCRGSRRRDMHEPQPEPLHARLPQELSACHRNGAGREGRRRVVSFLARCERLLRGRGDSTEQSTPS